MVAVIKARRKAPVLTPSSLACLSRMPTINLTAGCLHGCAYCYTRGYSTFPGDGTVIVYENALYMLRDELARRRKKPQAVYFSPSSDLFQPAREVLELARAVLEFLFRSGVGVAFLSKGNIPDDMLALLVDHAELVRAQVGIITVDEGIARAFEPNAAGPGRRLEQIEALVAGGVSTEARVDPILPRLTDAPDQVERPFRALAVRRAHPELVEGRPQRVEGRAASFPALRQFQGTGYTCPSEYA